MKNLIVLILCTVVLFSCDRKTADQSNFTITGEIAGEYDGNVYLFQREGGEWIKLDSSATENGSFTFEGYVDLPEVHYIASADRDIYVPLFVEAGEIRFNTSADAFRDAEISGSDAQEQYEAFMRIESGFEENMGMAWENIKKADEEGDDRLKDKWEEKYDSINDVLKQYILDYALQNDASPVAAYVVRRNSYYFDEKDLEPVVTGFDPSIHDSPYVKYLIDRVKTLKRVAVGQSAVDFTMEDTTGKPVVLSSLYGNYLLVDFWASWCGPCRRENPNIVAVYNDYHNKGFDVLGVSFDRERDDWLKAIRNDNLTWHHVSDLQGWGNAAGKLYAVNSIPSSVLLDPEGIIIAKNLRGEELRSKLEELLDQ